MEIILNNDELLTLIEKIKSKIEKEIIKANRIGALKEELDKYNFIEEDYAYYEPKKEKVLVIGQTSTSVNELKSILKKYGINNDRFDFVLEYEDVKKFPIKTLRNNQKYCDIFIGPIPHKINGLEDCKSLITHIQNNQSEYPKLTKLMSSDNLKITKASFEEALLNSQLMKKIINK